MGSVQYGSIKTWSALALSCVTSLSQWIAPPALHQDSKFLCREDKENFRVAINCERVHFHFRREPPFLAKNSVADIVTWASCINCTSFAHQVCVCATQTSSTQIRCCEKCCANNMRFCVFLYFYATAVVMMLQFFNISLPLPHTKSARSPTT